MLKSTGLTGRDADLVILDELEAIDFEKKKRPRGTAPNKTSNVTMWSFVKKMASLCPHFMGGRPEYFDAPSVPADALLARVISAINYIPSSIGLLANPAALARFGIIEDHDLCRMSLRQITAHCSRPMLDELEAKILEHEGKLILAADIEPPFDPKTAAEDIEIPATEVIDDPMLGRVEVDSLTGEIVRVIPDTDALGEVLVDAEAHVEVDTHTETAKRSNIWGSW